MSTNDLSRDMTGPGSPLYEVLSDGSALYAILPAFLYVVLSPEGSKGVDDHDRVAKVAMRDTVSIEDMLIRLLDTFDLVVGLAFAGNERAAVAHAIHELHRHIEGTLDDGTRYHAWNKDVWAWTWAGILKPIMDTHEELRGFKTASFRQDVYTGFLQIGALFRAQGLPEQYSDFEVYWKEVWIPYANDTGTGQFIMDLARQPLMPRFAPWIPRPVWQRLTWPMRHFFWTGMLLTIPPEIEQKLGITRTWRDRIAVRAHRSFWRMLPRPITSRWVSTYFHMRLKFGNPSWRNHYSYESLDQYRIAMKEAKKSGSKLPPRPSARHVTESHDSQKVGEIAAGCPFNH
ncbi:MAG: oxygenase MpaB family protein [Moraxellaceae bacterium]|nr:oxygenase MpaB family protein [Moraxellaceae bacterium]MDZ4387887.1 oxygenase MpaB family protein [Moraxellaceae bacterium]